MQIWQLSQQKGDADMIAVAGQGGCSGDSCGRTRGDAVMKALAGRTEIQR